MASSDVYVELFIIFVISFLILTFFRNIGNQLVFMLIAFIMSGIIGEAFTRGIKGVMSHPLVTRGSSPEARQEQLHEKKYIFFIFFLFIVVSTLIGTGLSNDILNNVVYPALGNVQGTLLVSGVITLVLYITMLWIFEEKLLNATSVGLIAIIVAIAVLFVFFSGYTSAVINYVTGSLHTIQGYIKV